jgi:L-asparaginase/N4-(beta-N-acetylglucosaminyl)-L-asparaginase
MPTRRDFLRLSAAGSAAVPFIDWPGSADAPTTDASRPARQPIVVSTWNHGKPANDAAWSVLQDETGYALDAVEKGVGRIEADPNVHTVGLGGRPDASGAVTLDACVMDEAGHYGAVAALERILHPTAVARRVKSETAHSLLVGDGAHQFARSQGFEEHDLLTDEMSKAWRKWKQEHPDAAPDAPTPNIENQDSTAAGGEGNHDTIGMLALDKQGRLSGACTTSGTAWKRRGRVGDSPLIGSGLFLDPDVGAACATGWGEAIMRVVGAHVVIEAMRHGAGPEAACRKAARQVRRRSSSDNVQAGFLALTADGRAGAHGIRSGFDVAIYDESDGNRLTEAPSLVEAD